MLLLWKLKKLVAIVMFAAALISLISFFMNFGYVIDLFNYQVNDFNSFARVIDTLIAMLFMPLVLFTLGLIALFIPRPNN